MTEEQFVISTFDQWSFSRLNSFEQCPYEWELHYIKCNKSEPSFFTQYGSYIHKILELYGKGEVSYFEMLPYYEEHYAENIICQPPNNQYVDLGQSYYDQGIEFFSSVSDFAGRQDINIIGVEKEVHFEIGGEDFVGFIDLLVEDSDGRLICVDHKSSKLKILKSGKISKSDRKHFLSFEHQLYLYSKAIKEEYGKFPKTLAWNLFRLGRVYEIPFKEEDYKKTLVWAEKELEKIKSSDSFPPNPDRFYCWNLCGQRNNYCEYKAR